jgi:hypothetical protein
MKISGLSLARKWGLVIKQARYSKWGNWYESLTDYPAALLDANGYVLFPNENALRSNPKIKITKQINISSRISSLSDYVQVIGFFPEELTEVENVPEGAQIAVFVNKYERNALARKRCLEYYGFLCAVCRCSMAEIYGPLADKLIHVHHLRPLSDIKEEYMIDPIADLRPVCPNCHAFLHLSTPPTSIDEAIKIIAESAGKSK